MAILDITEPRFGAKPKRPGDSIEFSRLPDAADAIEAAMKTLDQTSSQGNKMGGRILIPHGTYRIGKTVNITRPVIIEGEGSHHWEIGTTVLRAEPGVTPFRIFAGFPNQPQDGYAQRTVIRDLVIDSAGKDFTELKGDYDKDEKKIKLTSPKEVNENVKEWQLISIGGAGYVIRLKGITAEYINHVTDQQGNIIAHEVKLKSPKWRFGIYDNAYLVIPDLGFPYPSRIIRVDRVNPTELNVVLKHNDNIDNDRGGSTAKVYLATDFLARIIHRQNADSDSPVLTVDAHSPIEKDKDRFRIMKDVEIRHADAGIDALASIKCENVIVHNMKGPGFAIIANHDFVPGSNAGVFHLDTCMAFDCEYGMYILGADASGGLTSNFLYHGTRSEPQSEHKWAIVDFSHEGNTHIGATLHGGYGVITRGKDPGDDPGNACLILNLYQDDGTISFLGYATTTIQGFGIRQDQHSFNILRGVVNHFQIGDSVLSEATGFSSYMRIFRPNDYLEQYRAKDSQNYYKFCKTAIKGEDGEEENTAVPGWYVHKHTGAGLIPFCWSDDNAIAGPGHFWVPGGISLGRNEGNAKLSEENRRTLTYGTSFEDIANREKFIPPKKGDIVFNSNPDRDNNPFAGWICMNPSDPDIRSRWKPFGKIEGL